MNANAVARNYSRLTPEERFRLVLAASGRGDEAERDRLAHAGARMALSLPDHSPYALAFQDLAEFTFIELLEAAACQRDTLDLADDAEQEAEGGRRKKTVAQKFLDPVLVAGFVLRTKAEGWKLFCERLNVPPFLLWEEFPGFDRLQRALALAEKATFDPKGFLHWLNAARPAEKPELTDVPLTVEGVADATAKMFHQRAEWWGS